jgi:hypothetical protein
MRCSIRSGCKKRTRLFCSAHEPSDSGQSLQHEAGSSHDLLHNKAATLHSSQVCSDGVCDARIVISLMILLKKKRRVFFGENAAARLSMKQHKPMMARRIKNFSHQKNSPMLQTVVNNYQTVHK